jgi:hypothetical protein
MVQFDVYEEHWRSKVDQYSMQRWTCFDVGNLKGRAYHLIPFLVLFLNCTKVVCPLKSGYLLDTFPQFSVLRFQGRRKKHAREVHGDMKPGFRSLDRRPIHHI